MSKLREKLEHHRVALGSHICMNESVLTEILGWIGFDYLWIDTEHTTIGLEKLEQHLMAARAAGVSAIVRVPWNDPVRLKPVLEMGPDGIIIPMVNSHEEAQQAMRACLYPPKGIRGYGPKFASRFGITPMQEYLDHVAQDTLRFIQIEHIDAVNDLDQIVQLPDIDGFIIGPCDLAASMGHLHEVECPEMDAVFRRIIQTVHNAGKPVGVSYGLCSDELIARWMDRGVDMISLGCESDFVISGARKLFKSMQTLSAKQE